jgi:hypothetical protein
MYGNIMNEQSVPNYLKILWVRGWFSSNRTFKSIKTELSSSGSNPSDDALRKALRRTKFLTKKGKGLNATYIQKHSAKKIVLNNDVLPDELISALGKDFEVEIYDLRINYGQSGTCTAFLLRKILEKLIFITFAKNELNNVLEDNSKAGGLVGLQTMLNLAVLNKIKGKPFLMARTAKSIEGAKFLGDTSAHNPLVNVSMKTIEQAMPFIVIAYSELSKKL